MYSLFKQKCLRHFAPAMGALMQVLPLTVGLLVAMVLQELAASVAQNER